MKIPTDAELAQGLKSISGSGYEITGDRRIADVKLLSQRQALHLEMHGMKITRGYSALKVVKNMFAMKGNRLNVFKQFDALVTERTGLPFHYCERCDYGEKACGRRMLAIDESHFGHDITYDVTNKPPVMMCDTCSGAMVSEVRYCTMEPHHKGDCSPFSVN